jgi:hypothetical protein
VQVRMPDLGQSKVGILDVFLKGNYIGYYSSISLGKFKVDRTIVSFKKKFFVNLTIVFFLIFCKHSFSHRHPFKLIIGRDLWVQPINTQ